MKKHFIKHLFSVILAFTILITFVPFNAFALFNDTSLHTSNSFNLDKKVFILEEDITKRGEFEKHYICSDGAYIVTTYSEAIHYNDENGNWKDINNSLSFDNTKNVYTTNNKNFNASFADSANNNNLITLTYNDYDIEWQILTDKVIKESIYQKAFLNSQSKPEIISDKYSNTEVSDSKRYVDSSDSFYLSETSSKIIYNNIFGDLDKISLNYTIFQNKVEEDIIINSKCLSNEFIMNMKIGELIAVLNEDNSVSLVNNKGVKIFNISTPYMIDTAGDLLNNIDVIID